jgi:cell division transport system permease protein
MAESHSLLPKDRAERAPLVAVMAVMCYLAGLSLAANLMLARATASWSADLAGAVTVQIKPRADIKPQDQIATALALLRATPGIAAAKPLPDAEVQRLLEPWLGKGVALSDLPVPRLIDVEVERGASLDLKTLSDNLARQVPGATLDDHRTWNERLMRFAGRLSGMGVAVLVLVTIAAAAIVVFATRAGLHSNKEIVEVLHLVGARAGFIAGEFERDFLWLALRAGFLGVAAVALTLVGLGLLTPQRDFFLPRTTIFLTDGIFLALVPVACALVAMITARLTVLNVLRQTS